MITIKRLSLGEIGANCYFICNEGKAVVIDPGAEGKTICEFAEKLNVDVKAIILTHGHFDHIGAVGYLKDRFDCTVYINKNDEALLSDTQLNLSERFSCDIVYRGEYICLQDQVVNIIGLDFECISTPGHTPGSMCVKVEDKIFTGDTLFKGSIGNAFPPYGDTALEISSIKQKLMTIDNAECFPGHGESTTILIEKQTNPYLF